MFTVTIVGRWILIGGIYLIEEIEKGQWKGWTRLASSVFEKTFPGKVTIRCQQGYFYRYKINEDTLVGPYGTLDEALTAETDDRKSRARTGRN